MLDACRALFVKIWNIVIAICYCIILRVVRCIYTVLPFTGRVMALTAYVHTCKQVSTVYKACQILLPIWEIMERSFLLLSIVSISNWKVIFSNWVVFFCHPSIQTSLPTFYFKYNLSRISCENHQFGTHLFV